MGKTLFPRNCPIRQFTADGRSAGRCWYYLPDGRTCPTHGDVSVAVKKYLHDGGLTDEPEHRVAKALEQAVLRGVE